MSDLRFRYQIWGLFRRSFSPESTQPPPPPIESTEGVGTSLYTNIECSTNQVTMYVHCEYIVSSKPAPPSTTSPLFIPSSLHRYVVW